MAPSSLIDVYMCGGGGLHPEIAEAVGSYMYVLLVGNSNKQLGVCGQFEERLFLWLFGPAQLRPCVVFL